ncbi:MAG: RecQ family ATP-dependent DNA helicase [Anaerolineae bacterium]|nr:RecQ family ATP-dependent DNA helicase [Anaerolineae bacterium]
MRSDFDMPAELGLAAAEVPQLGSNERSRLLNFLLRWEHLALLHTCLDDLLAKKPGLVSLRDLRVKALVIEGRFPEAVSLMQQRLKLKSGLSAQALMARVHLAAGEIDAACRIAKALCETEPDRPTTSYVAAEVALAKGDMQAALAAYQRVGLVSASRRGYLLGMMRLHQAQEDFVSASGYAVSLLATVETPEELPISYLRRLREYFVASDEQTHVHEIDEAIGARYTHELDELKRSFGEMPATTPQSSAPHHDPTDAPISTVAANLDSGPRIVVTPAEQRRVTQAVHDMFGFGKFLPGQMETMAHVLRGNNALTVLPTGGGKSLCYQVPAMLSDDGVTLVISPLIALMKDQVDSLPDLIRDRATTINSSLDGDTLRRRLDRAAQGEYRLLYAAPERLRQPAFLHALRRVSVNRLVVDEAHCVSVWGHDFRPDYLKLRDAWHVLGEPPILALTATAPPRVRLDIVRHLSPDQPMAIVTGDFARLNLQLEVFRAANKDSKLGRLVAFCKNTTGSGIVYADTRARCEQLATMLREQGVNAAHYHAGIQNRAEVQEAFMAGQTRVMVATIAFGMGIDKPDIRFVVHYMPPASLESYYQEAGRAGRDGLPARCLLMVSSADRGIMTRRMRRDLPTLDFLRSVYAAVLRHLGPREAGNIARGDLERELQVDGTRVRVAISILEENELLERGPDIPRAALIRANHSPRESDPQGNGHLAAYFEAAHLQLHRWVRVNLVDAADSIGLSPKEIESQILAWSDQGHLSYRFSGRDMLLTRHPVPDDIAARINQWLERFETLQVQRIAEITSYVRTRRCRHGHLNAYLGGRRIASCKACDNCIAVPQDTATALPPQEEQLIAILDCAARAPWSWGKVSLSRILRGDRDAPAKGRDYPGFGVLSYRSRSAILDLIGELEEARFLQPRQLDHGGIVLDITRLGRKALREPARLEALVRAQPLRITLPPENGQKWEQQSLFDLLSNWRVAQARQRGVPPFQILHQQVVHRIATQQPQTLEALLAIKGIGSRKLESYGQEILGVVRAYLSRRPSAAQDRTHPPAADTTRAR